MPDGTVAWIIIAPLMLARASCVLPCRTQMIAFITSGSSVATELPEVMNAIIWVRQGKTQLALANISGAMMIQATLPSGIGILFTPWKFSAALVLSGLVTMVAIVYVLSLILRRRFTARRLSWAAAFYAVFAIGLIVLDG